MYAHDKKKFVSPNLTTDYMFATWNWESPQHWMISVILFKTRADDITLVVIKVKAPGDCFVVDHFALTKSAVNDYIRTLHVV